MQREQTESSSGASQDERGDAGGRYVLIVGHGRSGTNWLLDMLDVSPMTHCRNEPNEILNSPMARLPLPWVRRDPFPELEASWDRAICWTLARMGERDHAMQYPKLHLYDFVRRLGVPRLLNRRRVRSLLGLFVRSVASGEWLLPRMFGSRKVLGNAVGVLKLVQVPAWAVWVLHNRPQVKVLHIVRHPAGFLNSWKKRYLSHQDSQAVSQANRQRLRKVIEAEPAWSERFGDIDAMSVEESELWYWRVACETIHAAGQSSAAYKLVLYDELAADAMRGISQIYSHCLLHWDDRILCSLQELASNSASIAAAGTRAQDAHVRNLLRRVVAPSSLGDWWPSV